MSRNLAIRWSTNMLLVTCLCSCFVDDEVEVAPITIVSSQAIARNGDHSWIRYIASFDASNHEVTAFSRDGKRVDLYDFDELSATTKFDLKPVEDSVYFTYTCGYVPNGNLKLEGVKALNNDSLILLKYQDNLFIKVDVKTGKFDTVFSRGSEEVTYTCHQGFGIIDNPHGGYILMAPPNETWSVGEPMVAVIGSEPKNFALKNRIIPLPEVYESRAYGYSYFSSAVLVRDSLVVSFMLDSTFYVYDLGDQKLTLQSSDYAFQVSDEKKDSLKSTQFEAFMTHIKCLVYHKEREELVRVIIDKRKEEYPKAVLEFYDKQLIKKGEATISLSKYWYKPIPYNDHYLLVKNEGFPGGDSLYFDEVKVNF